MRGTTRAERPITRRQRKLDGADAQIKPIESSIPFILFMVFMLAFYLRFASRVPAIAPFRPDLLLALITAAAAFPYLGHRAGAFQLPVAKSLNWLVVWIIVSLPFVEWPGSVLRENWYVFTKAALLFYFAILLVDTPSRLRWFVFVFVGCQVFRVMEPLYLNLTTGYMGGATYLGAGEFAGRLSGAPADVINPNGLGFVIATTAIFIHFLLWQSENKLAKLIYLGLMPAMLYALILTMSRGGFIALLVGGGLIFWQSRHKAVLIVVAIGIAMAGWSVMNDYQRDRYLSLVSDDAQQSDSRQGRIDGMIDEFKLGLNKPMFGHGLGTTPEAKVNIRGSRSQAAHNLYAEVLIELGIAGLALFISFMWRIRQLVRSNLSTFGSSTGDRLTASFEARLNRAMVVAFWVYAVYSINYFGLSQDYWYVFGGLCVAFGTIMGRVEESASIVGRAHPRAKSVTP